MKAPTDPQLERCETEAALFLIQLTERPEDADLQARCAAWQEADPLHAAVWARTLRSYDLLGKLGPSEARAAVQPGPMATGRRGAAAPRPALGRRRVAASLAFGAAAASAAAVFGPSLIQRLSADAVTGRGEVRTITLADGSEVSLAPESALAIAFTPSQRRVHLLRGEAFFSVTRDTARPFSVTAGEAVVTVLGTGFDVRWLPDGLAVAVQHGHVRVDAATGPSPVTADLLAGDWLRLNWAGGMTRGEQPADEVADWRQGRLIARDRPISDIVDSLRGYYHGAILLEDPAFASRHVTGLYDLRQPVETLRALAAAHGARMRRLSPWVMLVTPA